MFFSLGNFISDYWQKRARKSLIIEYESSDSSIKKYDVLIDKKTFLPKVLDNTASAINFELELKKIASNNHILFNRWRLRFEYIIHMIFNFHKIKNHKYYIKWIFGRVVYIFSNFFKEGKNPNIIYEKYKH